jgi:hypothetical protein
MCFLSFCNTASDSAILQMIIYNTANDYSAILQMIIISYNQAHKIAFLRLSF